MNTKSFRLAATLVRALPRRCVHLSSGLPWHRASGGSEASASRRCSLWPMPVVTRFFQRISRHAPLSGDRLPSEDEIPRPPSTRLPCDLLTGLGVPTPVTPPPAECPAMTQPWPQVRIGLNQNAPETLRTRLC
jgi:hypothetical protein